MLIDEISGVVDQIVAKRHEQEPEIRNRIDAVKARIEWLNGISDAVGAQEEQEKDPSLREDLQHSRKRIKKIVRDLEDRVRVLEDLRLEFSRDTINLGVSGEARVGKSTTLQKITGLTDVQIPTGKGLPVTAVRSEIFNDGSNRAEITFRTPDTFVRNYIQPHLENINEVLRDDPLVITSIEEFRSRMLPSLGNSVPTAAANSLRELQQAQRSYQTYAKYLTGETRFVELDDLRDYVAYPSNHDLQLERDKNIPANRAYLAVERAEIFCEFPGLGNTKVGLIDLPGLGEIGRSAADIHLKGLEDKVDQIFLITQPTEEKGYFDQALGNNIDQLLTVQPGIKNRSDLITIGINVKQGAEESCKTLRDDFERNFNAAQESDKFEIVDFSAIDADSAQGMFQHLLAKISKRLPSMDEQKLEYAMAEGDLEEREAEVLEELDETLAQMIKRIPLPDRALNQKIDEVGRGIIGALTTLENQLRVASSEKSEVHEKFENDVRRIHDNVQESIDNGFFRGGWPTWESKASGQVDYYTFYRSEARRIRREIIDAYGKLDAFYTEALDSFQNKVLDGFLKNAGSLEKHFHFAKGIDSRDRIRKVARELKTTVRDEDLLAALNLLQEANFTFRSNVFLQIEEHLGNLANPDDVISKGWRDSRPTTKRDTLGGAGDSAEKIDLVKKYLTEDAVSANDAIEKALLDQNDNFNRYQAIYASFFNDYLFRKDEENFKHNVIRALINEYRGYFFQEEQGSESEPRRRKLEELRKALASGCGSKIPKSLSNVGRTKTERKPQSFERNARRGAPKITKQEWADKFEVGQHVEGLVQNVDANYGVFVWLGEYTALIPAKMVSVDAFKVRQKVEAVVVGKNEKLGHITLSIERFEK